MCLWHINKTYRKPSTAIRRAWKIIGKNYDGVWATPFQGKALRVGEWVVADPCVWLQTEEARHREYTAGFHVYSTRKGAETALKLLQDSAWVDGRRSGWRVIEVLVSHVMYEGKDGTSDKLTAIDNLVVQQMLVPKFAE
jgi:hypothetical protein